MITTSTGACSRILISQMNGNPSYFNRQSNVIINFVVIISQSTVDGRRLKMKVSKINFVIFLLLLIDIIFVLEHSRHP